MKTIYQLVNLLILLTFLSSKDSLAIMKYNPNLGLDMKGLINQPNSSIKITEQAIEFIINKTKNHSIENINADDVVYIETSVGKFKLKLFPEVAPKHCKNFKRLANSGFYDGTTFHRVIKGFMIQGGDILSRDFNPDNDGMGGPGWIIPAEFNNKSHKRGILSMARSTDPNSAGSQFFICVEDAFHLDNNYTVFGEVINNIHIIDRIVKSPTGYSVAKMSSKPVIPAGENKENWVNLTDPKTGKEIFSKIPLNMNPNSYRQEQQRLLNSDKPLSEIIIKKIRVKPDDN
tara:strand:- start:8217 stop:9080 length:864 start_codon:yes stop_codon:yes gene_type:complete